MKCKLYNELAFDGKHKMSTFKLLLHYENLSRVSDEMSKNIIIYVMCRDETLYLA